MLNVYTVHNWRPCVHTESSKKTPLFLSAAGPAIVLVLLVGAGLCVNLFIQRNQAIDAQPGTDASSKGWLTAPRDTIVATVGDREVRLDEIANYLGDHARALGAHDQQYTRRQLMRGVERLAIILEARANELHLSPEFQLQVRADIRARLRAKESQLAAKLARLDSRFAAPRTGVDITEADIAAHIKANLKEYEGVLHPEATRSARRQVTREKYSLMEDQWKALTLKRLKTDVVVNDQSVPFELIDTAMRHFRVGVNTYHGVTGERLTKLLVIFASGGEIPEILVNGHRLPSALIGPASVLNPAEFADMVWNNVLAEEAREQGLDVRTGTGNFDEEMFIEALILERLQLAVIQIDASGFEPTDDEIAEFMKGKGKRIDDEHLRTFAREVLRVRKLDKERRRYAATLIEKHGIETTVK